MSIFSYSSVFVRAFYLWAVWKLLQYIVREYQFNSFARSRQCEPPAYARNDLPWGIDRVWRLVRLTGKGADVMENVIMPSFRAYGWTFCMTGLFGEESILTADPENLRAVFSSQFHDFLTGPRRAAAFGYMLGKCIFTTDGAFWEHSRALIKPHMSTGQVNEMSATERAVDDFLYALMVRSEKDREWTSAVDLHPLFLRFTLDQGTDFLFGANVKSQLAAIPGAVSDLDEVTRVAADKAGSEMTFSDAFHYASVEVTKRAKLQGLYWLADTKKARQAVGYLRRFVDYLVDHTLRMQGGQARGNGASEKRKLLQALAIEITDPIELRDQVLFMLVASRDTTAALLSWMFLMLAKHPAIYRKLRKIVLEEFGSEHEPICPITFNTLKKCRYLQWVMYETLRLYPPGPLNSRIAAYDTTLPRGGGPDGKSPIAIRAGQTVNICVYAMQRRTDLWGDDALLFRPERWEGRKSDWTWLPFSGGPRTCLGSKCPCHIYSRNYC
jgi:cytochrome P450